MSKAPLFQRKKVPTYIQSVKFSGDAEKSALQVAFYNTPLPYELLYEIDDRAARQLFRREGKDFTPVAELDDVTLKIGEPGVHNIEFYPHDAEGADGAGQMVAGCVIGKVECSKLFADKPDWSLIWHVTMPLDSHSCELLRKYYRQTAFLTLDLAQTDLGFQSDDKKVIVLDDATVESGKEIICQVCNQRATYLGMDQSGWCDNDVKAAVGIQVRKIKYVGDAA